MSKTASRPIAVKGGISLKIRFDESEIQDWACKYVNDLNEEEALQEEELLALEPKIKARSYLLKSELVKVVEWKLQNQPHRLERNLKYIENNSDAYLEDITRCAFSAKSERARIRVLRCLDGVELPIASAVLHLFHKCRYPIWDTRALWTVQLDESQYKNRAECWDAYVDFCRKVADRNNLCMRTLDRALWKYSKGKKS